MEFLEQFWGHIHSYEAREIIVVDTGSVDGTFEKLLTLEKDDDISYTLIQEPHYTGQVYIFNRVISLATSKWVMKIDADELYRHETVCRILDEIEEDEFNCINIPTIHHFINSDLYFDVLDEVPDYHQRVFRRDVFLENAETHSKNHGSIIWAKPLNILTLGREHSMFHYTMLRPFKKILKRSIINYYIDIDKTRNEAFMKDIEENTDFYIDLFRLNNIPVVPAWQIIHSPIPFNTLEHYYEEEFVTRGKRVDFPKPEDLIVNKIATWPNEEKILKLKLW